MTRPIKVAVLSFAHTHAASYIAILSQMPGVEVLTTDPEAPDSRGGDDGLRGQELADHYGVNYVDTYAEAIAWGPDAVIITSENAYHRRLVEMAAEAGPAILCEKPLATTVSDAQAIVETVNNAGVRLMMAHPTRFSPAVAQLKHHIDSGALGEVLGFVGTNNGQLPTDQRAWFTDPDLAGGGAIVDHVVHCTDIIDHLIAQDPKQVYAQANTILHADRGLEVETGGMVTITYPNGVIASIDCSWSYPDEAPTWGELSLEVVGTKGRMTIAPFDPHVGGFHQQGYQFLPVGDNLDRLMLEEFLTMARTNTHPQPDVGLGWRMFRIVDAARSSAQTHTPTTID